MGDTVKREKQLEEANTSADLRKNNKVAVVLPVYKTEMDMSEQASFEQCLKVLGGYDIFLVTHAQLNTDFYEKIARKQGTKLSYAYFDKAFFRNIRGYNSLMLSIDFYRQFERYSHILIHQLDAFVFRDELPYWTSLPYDYVGAPWFEGVPLTRRGGGYFGQ